MMEVQQRRRKRRLGDAVYHRSNLMPDHNPHHHHQSVIYGIRVVYNEPYLIPGEEDGQNNNRDRRHQWYSTFAPSSSGTISAADNLQADWSASKSINSYADYVDDYWSSSWGGWDYFLLLYSCLFLWVTYLLFPRGCRRRFCGAIPRRYARSKWKTEFEESWTYSKGMRIQSSDSATPYEGTLTSASHITSSSGCSTTADSYNNNNNWMGVDERRRRERQVFFQELQEAREEGRHQFQDSQQQQQRHQHPGANRQGSIPVHQTQQQHTTAAISGLPHKPLKPGTDVEKGSSSSAEASTPHGDKYDTGQTNGSSSSAPSSANVWSTAPSGGGGTKATTHPTTAATATVTNRPPPSPEHPGIARLPPSKILNETMDRLRKRGIRLIAHGVQCDPKRVWIRLDEEITSVTWQTEYPRRIVNQSGEGSIVLMRGALHRIALPNVLYVDVGKKTSALMRKDNASIPDGICFSLLTQNGSLDLQTNSKLERDALVSCFSLVLDQVHTEDWRNLYEESPAPSQTPSSNYDSVSFSHIPSDMVEI